MYITHLTLSTGHTTRIERGAVAGETLARVAPWLEALVDTGANSALPVSALADYSARASVLDGALLVTISGPAGADGRAPPLVTMGVAKRSRHGAALWPLLTTSHLPGMHVRPGLQRPAEPWCAAALHATLALHPDAATWLGDLERCIAWAWVTRPAQAEDAAA